MTDEGKAICEKLDKMTTLIAFGLIKDKAPREQMAILSRAKFQPKEIADILGVTAHNVSVVLSSLRKKKK